MNASQQVRLRFIDFVLDRFGMLNRADLMDVYGMSTVEASLDLRAYIEHAPGNLRYDPFDKCYRRTANFTRQFP